MAGQLHPFHQLARARPRLTGRLGLIVVACTLAACDVERDRPTGFSALPPTTAQVTFPPGGEVVRSGEVTPARVRATGLVQAVEVVLRDRFDREELFRERMELEELADSLEVEFGLEVPELRTGTNLEVLGVAENVAGERTVSEPVTIQVIECDVFPIACEGL